MHPEVYLELFEDEMGLDTMGLTQYYPQLIETIQKRTFPVFSEMFPCILPYLINLNDNTNRVPDQLSGSQSEFRVDEPLLDDFGLKVVGYRQVFPAFKKDEYENGYRHAYIGGMAAYSGSFDEMLIGNLSAQTNSLLRETIGLNPVCKQIGPRLFSLKHFAHVGPFVLELMITYPSVSSIRETFKRYFLNLAKYDVGVFLYAKLKYMQDVVTPAGNLDLRISDWENYPQEREDYIKELRTLSFPDRLDGMYYLAI